jgi:hypothetical protein
MYLDAADAEWKGAPDNEDAAEDIV